MQTQTHTLETLNNFIGITLSLLNHFAKIQKNTESRWKPVFEALFLKGLFAITGWGRWRAKNGYNIEISELL